MTKDYETEYIDKLFLELSQITKARTAREGKLLLLVQALSNKLSKKEGHSASSIIDVAQAEHDFYGPEIE